MAGSIYGKIFQVSTWGESHGKGIGVVIDGCPAGLPLKEEDIQVYLNRRRPGQSRFSTPRKEEDQVELLSGVFEGRTTGTPIAMIVWNKTQISKDYSEIAAYYRPGHADYTFDQKYGFRDYRGGGRSSGRETIARVAAGAVAEKILSELNIEVFAYTTQIGEIGIETFDKEERDQNPFCMPDKQAALKAEMYLEQKMKENDSVGGIIECRMDGVKAGIGEPVFDKLDSCLAKAIVSIGAVKGFEIGAGFEAACRKGSENNDSFCIGEKQCIKKKTNYAGGILGGISDGSQILFRAAIKPTPSIAKKQHTINQSGEEIEVQIKGRHDPIIVPRAVVVVESMAAITVLDLLLQNMTSKMDYLYKIYQEK